MDVEIADVVVDCADPEAVAQFWSALLQRDVGGRRGPYVWLAEAERQPGMAFQRTEQPRPDGKNRMHVDLRVEDVRTAQAEAERLGAVTAPGYEDGGFLVMTDPEGNVFCLLPKSGFRLDEQGRADYLSTEG